MTHPIADPYAVLGVPRGASRAQVRAAYLRLAKQHHPDLHHDAVAGERMRRINQAWEILSNPISRERSAGDAWQRSPARSSPSATTPRRQRPAAAAPSGWTTTGQAATSARSGAAPSPVPVATILFAVPFVGLALVAIGAGILPLPLLGIIVVLLARGASRSGA